MELPSLEGLVDAFVCWLRRPRALIHFRPRPAATLVVTVLAASNWSRTDWSVLTRGQHQKCLFPLPLGEIEWETDKDQESSSFFTSVFVNESPDGFEQRHRDRLQGGHGRSDSYRLDGQTQSYSGIYGRCLTAIGRDLAAIPSR